MAKKIVLLGLSILLAASMSAQAATLFEDNFDGTTLDTSKWTASGSGTVTVADGNVTLDVPSGDWTYSQIDSVSTWTADSDLYYSFTIGDLPEGGYNIIQVFEGTAQTGYVAMRNDAGGGGWWFDAREGAAGSATYHGYEQPDASSQVMMVGDVYTLKLGPTGSAAYKNGNLFDSCSVVPLGTIVIDAQSWLSPGGVASQTFDSISVSDIEPTHAIPGDANNDGAVDVSDLGILATNYGAGDGFGWSDADFTGDGVVDVSDLGILATAYGTGTTAQAVPEPSMLVLLVAGLAVLAWRKRA